MASIWKDFYQIPFTGWKTYLWIDFGFTSLKLYKCNYHLYLVGWGTSDHVPLSNNSWCLKKTNMYVCKCRQVILSSFFRIFPLTFLNSRSIQKRRHTLHMPLRFCHTFSAFQNNLSVQARWKILGQLGRFDMSWKTQNRKWL